MTCRLSPQSLPGPPSGTVMPACVPWWPSFQCPLNHLDVLALSPSGAGGSGHIPSLSTLRWSAWVPSSDRGPAPSSPAPVPHLSVGGAGGRRTGWAGGFLSDQTALLILRVREVAPPALCGGHTQPPADRHVFGSRPLWCPPPGGPEVWFPEGELPAGLGPSRPASPFQATQPEATQGPACRLMKAGT